MMPAPADTYTQCVFPYKTQAKSFALFFSPSEIESASMRVGCDLFVALFEEGAVVAKDGEFGDGEWTKKLNDDRERWLSMGNHGIQIQLEA